MATLADIDVPAWLNDLGLGNYAEAFTDNNIDGGVLIELTVDDLREIGVNSVGHRRRILAAINHLDQDSEPASPPADAAPEPETATPVSAERRMLTVMFCDLADSTALSVDRDPEDFGDLIRAFRSAIEGALEPFDAHIAQYAGDGLLAYFGYPNSSDRDAEKAVEASLAAVQAVSQLPPFDRIQPAVRIGLATGLTVVGGVDRSSEFRGDSAVGETLNLAARMQSLAAPNAIVIAQLTRQLVGGVIDCADIGEHKLKGFEQPVRAWQVLRRTVAVSRFDALRADQNSDVFVGRNAEIGLIRETRAAARTGTRKAVLIVGEAGIGKSRLAREALFGTDEGSANALILQCSPFQRAVPFYPIRYLIERASGIVAGEPIAESLTKLATYLEQVGPVTPEQLAIIGDLLGLENPSYDASRRMNHYQKRALVLHHLNKLACLALRLTPVLIVEDTQWIDPSTAELLAELVTSLQEQSVLIVITSRPVPPASWLDRAETVTIQLERLSANDSRQLVSSLLSDRNLPDKVVEAIAERCDGIPVFAEELTRGYSVESAAGELSGVLSQIPATLVDSVLERLDRLVHGRRIASVAAAIGREFPTALLIAVSGLAETTVRAGIRELLDAGIIVPGYSPFGEAICFRQMLVRDAAYQLLLRRDRKSLHLRVVKTLQSMFPTIAEALPHLMAIQMDHAGELVASAQEWNRAGLLAAQKSAYAEAVAHFTSGVETNDKRTPSAERSEQEFDLRLNLVGALIAARGYFDSEVPEQVEKLLASARELGKPEKVVPAMAAKWSTSDTHGSALRDLAFQIRDLAREGSDIDRLLGHRICATSHLFCAEIGPSIVEYNTFMSLYDTKAHAEQLRSIHGDPALMVMLGLTEAHTLTGELELADQWRERLLQEARNSERVHDLGHVLAFTCVHAALIRRDDRLTGDAAELAQVIDRNNLPFWRGHSDLFSGISMVDLGKDSEGLALARRGVSKLLEANVFSNCWYILFADTCLSLGLIDEVEEMLSHAEPSMEAGDMRFAPEFHRIKAGVAGARGLGRDAVKERLELGRKLAISQGTLQYIIRIEEDLATLD